MVWEGFGLCGCADATPLSRDAFLGRWAIPESMGAEPLQFKDRSEWRRWLEAHHATATEAPLFISKKSTSEGIHYLEALEEALCFGWIDGRLHSHDARRFVLRFSPRKADSVWSKANRERVQRLTRDGRMTPAGLATIREAKASGAWEEAKRSNEVPRMPQDLREALKADPVAWSHFRAWGDSYRGMAIGWVVTARKDATRRRRIARVVEKASRNERPGITGW